MNLYNYLNSGYNIIDSLVREWDLMWLNFLDSIFGEPLFGREPLYYENPFTEKDKESFTKNFGGIITDYFDIFYNSKGMVLVRKGLGLEGLVN